jgi:hypothetical protein
MDHIFEFTLPTNYEESSDVSSHVKEFLQRLQELGGNIRWLNKQENHGIAVFKNSSIAKDASSKIHIHEGFTWSPWKVNLTSTTQSNLNSKEEIYSP